MQGYKSPLFDINTVRMLASSMILWFLDRIYNSFSVLQISRVDNQILYYVLSSKISSASTLIVMVPSFLSWSASLSPLCCGGDGMYSSLFFFPTPNNMSKDTSLARREEVRRQRQHECFCVCVQGVGAREVSSSVALHLTSILITAFQQRSSSQPLPQSNGPDPGSLSP